MKIARIESFIFGTGSSKDLLFCRVETEDGTYGWGEGYVTAGKENVIAECVRAMAPHVIGRSVFNIRHTGQIMFEDFAIRRGSMELLSAWSADRDRLVGHHRQARRAAGLQPLGRRLARARAGLRQRLGRALDDRGGGGARPEGEGDGLHRRQVRPVPRALAHPRRQEGRGFRDCLCRGDARGAWAPISRYWSRRTAALRPPTRSASASASSNSASTGTRSPASPTIFPSSPRCAARCRSRSSPARRSIRRSSSSRVWRCGPPTSSTPTSARSAASPR